MRKRGKIGEARRYFEKALEANPQFVEAIDALVSLLREKIGSDEMSNLAAVEALSARKEEIAASRERYRAAFEAYSSALFGVGSVGKA
jgi:tetratricopeptide (TPR) repeat protein